MVFEKSCATRFKVRFLQLSQRCRHMCADVSATIMQDVVVPRGRASTQRTSSRLLTPTPPVLANASTLASLPHANARKQSFSTSRSVKASQVSLIHFNDVYNIEAREQHPVGGAARFVSKCKQLIQVGGRTCFYACCCDHVSPWVPNCLFQTLLACYRTTMLWSCFLVTLSIQA